MLGQFLEMLLAERGLARLSILSYKKDLILFFSYLKKSNLDYISYDDIQNFISHLIENNYSARSIARKITSIKSYCNFLVTENVMKENPALLIDVPKYSQKLPLFLSIEDIKKLINECKNKKTPEGYRLVAMIQLLYASGMRISELVSIKMTDVVFANANEIKSHFIIKGKGNKERAVISNEIANNSVKEYLLYRNFFVNEENQASKLFLFPSRSKQGYITRQNFDFFLKKQLPALK